MTTNHTSSLLLWRTSLLCSALWLLGMALPAGATNVWFARQSAVAHMSANDQALLNSTLSRVLNDQPDGSTTTWENPATGASGRIAVGKAQDDYGTSCRLIKMENTAKTITREGNYRLCKDGQGEWRFAPTSSTAK